VSPPDQFSLSPDSISDDLIQADVVGIELLVGLAAAVDQAIDPLGGGVGEGKSHSFLLRDR
jgi:hypothetical protein